MGALNFSWHSPWHAPSVDLVLECRRFTRKCMESCCGNPDEDRTGFKKVGKIFFMYLNLLEQQHTNNIYIYIYDIYDIYDIQIMYRYTLTYTCMKINHSPFIGSCNSIKETFYWHPSHFLKIGTEGSSKRLCPSAFFVETYLTFPHHRVMRGHHTGEALRCGHGGRTRTAPCHGRHGGKELETPRRQRKSTKTGSKFGR